jgi:Mrp family chromosome partitioning ATPase
METQIKLTISGVKLGTVPQLTTHGSGPWNVSEGIREHFRRVRSTLNLSSRQKSICVAVCSTCHGEGVSWVTAMLSCAIGEEGDPIFVIDYNRSHPSQDRIFGVEQDPGEPVTRPDRIKLVSRRTTQFNICILTPEAGCSNAQESAFPLRDALPSLRQMVNVILIDCGPMRDSSHLLDLAPAIDGVIFVVEAERERREVVARDLESIRRAGLRVFGIVLNKRKRYIPGWLYRAL